MAYRYSKTSSKYIPGIIDLLEDNFDIKNVNKNGLIKWKYFDSFLNNKTISYVAVDGDDKVVGHYINIPIKVSRATKVYDSMICTDMVTDKNHRGKGLISELSARVYKEVALKNVDFSMGFSNDEGVKVDINASGYGYKIVGRFVRYFKIVLRKKDLAYNLVKVNIFDDSFHEESEDYFRINKSSEFLNWRYLKKPNREYQIYAIKDDKKNLGYVMLRFLGRRCYVYDIVTKMGDLKHMNLVLSSIENKTLDRGNRLVIYNVLDNKYWQTLFNRYKYFKKEKNVVNYYFTVKLHRDMEEKFWILDKENWLLMNGDIL